MSLRNLGGPDGEVEPYCHACLLDRDFDHVCHCGWSYEERKESGWKLNGEKESLEPPV